MAQVIEDWAGDPVERWATAVTNVNPDPVERWLENVATRKTPAQANVYAPDVQKGLRRAASARTQGAAPMARNELGKVLSQAEKAGMELDRAELAKAYDLTTGASRIFDYMKAYDPGSGQSTEPPWAEDIVANVQPEDRQQFLEILSDMAKDLPKSEGYGKFQTRFSRGVSKMMFDQASALAALAGKGKETTGNEQFYRDIMDVFRQADPATAEHPIARGILSAAESASPMLMSMASAARGKIVPQMAFWTWQIQPALERKMLQEGVPSEVARAGSFLGAVTSASIEMINPMQGKVPLKKAYMQVVKNFLRQLGVETTEEVLQAISDRGFEFYTRKKFGGRPVDWDEEGELFIKELEEIGLSMPWLMLPGGVVGAAQTTVNIQQRRHQAKQLKKFKETATPEQRAARRELLQKVKRLRQLNGMLDKGFISKEDGIAGENRKERLAAAKAEAKRLRQEIDDALSKRKAEAVPTREAPKAGEEMGPKVRQQDQAEAEAEVQDKRLTDEEMAKRKAEAEAEAFAQRKATAEEEAAAEPPSGKRPRMAGEAEAAQTELEKKAKEFTDAVPAFRGATVEVDEQTKTAKVTTPSGHETTVHFDAETEVDYLEEQKKGPGKKKTARGAYVYHKPGSKGKMTPGIYLRNNATHRTINHEAIHWMEDKGIISKQEVEQHGGREKVARDYAAWVEQGRKDPNTLFQKIWAAVEKLLGMRNAFRDFETRTQQRPATVPSGRPAPPKVQVEVEPKRMFHGSTAADMTAWDPSKQRDVGIHVGDKRAASARLDRRGEDGDVYEVEFVPGTVLEVDDPGNWFGANAARSVLTKAGVPQPDVAVQELLSNLRNSYEAYGKEAAQEDAARYEELSDDTSIGAVDPSFREAIQSQPVQAFLERLSEAPETDSTTERAQWAADNLIPVQRDNMVRLLREQGIDTLKYWNLAETATPGEGSWSYAILDPNRAKIVSEQVAESEPQKREGRKDEGKAEPATGERAPELNWQETPRPAEQERKAFRTEKPPKQQQWEEQLTPEEKSAIKWVTDSLRQTRPRAAEMGKPLDPEDTQRVETIRKALSDAPTYSGDITRVVTLDKVSETPEKQEFRGLLKKLQTPGEVVELPYSVQFSARPDAVRAFTPDRLPRDAEVTVFRYPDSKVGYDISSASQYPYEGHVYVPQGTKVKVEGVRRGTLTDATGKQTTYTEVTLGAVEPQKAKRTAATVKQEADELLKAIGRKSKRLKTGVDPELVQMGLKYVALKVEQGVRSFSEIFGQLSTQLTEEDAKALKPKMQAEFDRLMVAEEPSETTGVRHEKTAEAREKAGMPERIPVTAMGWEAADAEAARRMKEDPTYAPRLAEELAYSPRVIDNVEQFVLNRHLRDIENRRKAGEDVYDELRLAVAASEEAAGSLVGRSLQARQAEYTEDYSVQDMVARHRRTLDTDPSREQLEQYEELSDRIKELEAENEKLRQQDVTPELEKRIKELEAEVKKKPQKTPKRGTRKAAMQKRKVAALDNFKSAWNDALKAGATTVTTGGLDPGAVAALQRLTKAAAGVVKVYVESGVQSFIELKANLRQDFGEMSDEQLAAFKKEWDKQKPVSPATVDLEAAEIGELAEQVMKWAVASGMTDRGSIIDTVHEVLQDAGLSRADTMRAMARYGKYARPRRQVASGRLQEVRGEIRQLVRLEEIASGTVPENVETRRALGEEEKALTKSLHEAMKRSGLSTTAPERQLTTPLTSKKKATQTRMAEVDKEITELEANIKSRTPLKEDGTRTELVVDEELVNMQEELKAKVQERNELRDKSLDYQAKREAKQRERYKKSLARREAFWKKRLQEAKKGKFPAKRPTSKYAKEFQDNIEKIEDLKIQFMAEVEKEKRRQWNVGQWIGHGLKETAMTLPRALMAGLEMSPVLRQGLPYTSGHPVLAFFNLVDAIPAIFIHRIAVAAHEKIENRSNYDEYLDAGIEFTTEAGKVVEEMYESEILRWLANTKHWAWIPGRWPAKGYRALERGVRVFSNTMRADVYDLLKRDTVSGREFFDKLGVKSRAWGEVDMNEAGRGANIFSGRGTGLETIGKGKSVLDVIAFAKRYVWSRIQMTYIKPIQLLTPSKLGQFQGDPAMRVAYAKLYGQALLGGLTHLAGLYFIMRLLADDDDEMPYIETSLRETDFGRLTVGETRIDVFGGIPKYITMAARFLTGHKTIRRPNGKLEVVSMTEGWMRGDNDIGRELRYKLSVPASAVVDFAARRTAVGEELPENRGLRAAAIARERSYPMAYPDMWQAEKELGWDRGTIVALEVFMGVGAQTYGPRTEYREANAAERKEMFKEDLKQMKWDTPPLAYSDFLSKKQLEVAENAKEMAKAKLISKGVATLKPREEYKNADTYHQRVLELNRANAEMKQMIKELDLSYEEAIELLKKSFEDSASKSEVSEKGYLKRSYIEKGAILDKLYGKEEGTSMK